MHPVYNTDFTIASHERHQGVTMMFVAFDEFDEFVELGHSQG